MSLPSQSKRSMSERSSVFRAKSQRGSSRFAFLLALVLILGAWILLRGDSEGEVSAAQSTQDSAQIPLGAVTPASEAGPKSESGWLDDVSLPGALKDSQAATEASSASPAPRSVAGSARAERGFAQLAAGDVLGGRRMLSLALMEDELPGKVDQRVRDELSALGERWILGPEILEGDRFCRSYTIRSGDLLSRLPKRQDLAIDWRLLQRINRIEDPARIRLGQSIKLVSGPFHVVLSKSRYRMDLYLGETHDRIFVRSFAVGHGEFDSTPAGFYQVRKDSKLINPAWTNPRTKERVAADDPENPIGEHWIGIEGVSPAVIGVEQLGIHGTTDLASIGKMRSMGCVRMFAADVALIYELLVRPASSIEIRP